MRLLLRNARLGPAGPMADIAIADGRIEAIAPDLPAAGELVDVDGRTVLPGLWDAHVHSVQWAAARRRVDLSGARSALDAAAILAKNAPAEGIVFGSGFRDGLWPDQPHKDLLQGALPGRPVVVASNDLHTAWLSPAALDLVGFGDHATGVVREQECFAVTAAVPQAGADELDAWVGDAAVAAAARGVVGVIDFEFADNVVDWRRRIERGGRAIRVACSVPLARLTEAIERGLRTGDPVAGTNELATVGPVKIFVDGSLNTRTAYCHDPYPGSQSYGQLITTPDQLRLHLATSSRAGLQPAVHAIGDHANDIALTAFEQVGCSGRIEHAQLLERRDLARFARAGLVAGIQPAHQPDDREVADRYWIGRTDRAFAYADLIAAGATIQIGSDAPVAPLDPWDGIAAAVGRTDDDRPPWHPEQAIGLGQALSAAALGRSGLAVGEPADLVITDLDPATADVASLRTMPIYGTMLAGRWTYGG
jgi:predicted amidohydrolase YtcJ